MSEEKEELKIPLGDYACSLIDKKNKENAIYKNKIQENHKFIVDLVNVSVESKGYNISDYNFSGFDDENKNIIITKK